MSEEPKDDVAAIRERRHQLIEKINGDLKKLANGELRAGDFDLSAEAEEVAELNRQIGDPPINQPTREQLEFIEFARTPMQRHGTKMPDFKALYEHCDELDRKLMTDG